MLLLKAYHGTKNLPRIMAAEAILCPYLSMGSEDISRKLFESELAVYNIQVADFALRVRKKRKEKGFRFEWEFGHANESEEALADIVEMNHKYFDVSDKDIKLYGEKKRNLHVFLTDYERAKSHAEGENKAIVQCELPIKAIRQGLSSRSTLIRERIPIEDVTAIYVDRELIYRINHMLKGQGFKIPIGDIEEKKIKWEK
jgi:hypothetical protein